MDPKRHTLQNNFSGPQRKKSENFGDFQLFLFGESMKLNPHPPKKKTETKTLTR